MIILNWIFAPEMVPLYKANLNSNSETLLLIGELLSLSYQALVNLKGKDIITSLNL